MCLRDCYYADAHMPTPWAFKDWPIVEACRGTGKVAVRYTKEVELGLRWLDLCEEHFDSLMQQQLEWMFLHLVFCGNSERLI